MISDIEIEIVPFLTRIYEINRLKILVDTCFFFHATAMNILEFEITQTMRWLIYIAWTHTPRDLNSREIRYYVQRAQIFSVIHILPYYLTEIEINKTLPHIPVTQQPATGIMIYCALITQFKQFFFLAI